jgi:Co/Zn/Cd efflux system component
MLYNRSTILCGAGLLVLALLAGGLGTFLLFALPSIIRKQIEQVCELLVINIFGVLANVFGLQCFGRLHGHDSEMDCARVRLVDEYLDVLGSESGSCNCRTKAYCR